MTDAPAPIIDPIQALARLVELKDIKDLAEKSKCGLSTEYVKGKVKAWENARAALKQGLPHASHEKAALARKTYNEFSVPDDGSVLDAWKKVVDVISASALTATWHGVDVTPPSTIPVIALCVYPNNYLSMQTVIWHPTMGHGGAFALMEVKREGKTTEIVWCPYVKMWCYIPELPTVWPEPLREEMRKVLG